MYALLATTTPLRDMVPLAAFGAHAAFHLAYAVLSAVAPRWCIEQNVKRVSRAPANLPLRLWNASLNVLNAADMGMHCLYAASLAAAVPATAASAAAVLSASASLAALAALRGTATAAAGGAERDVSGLTVVVTGASSGIGFEARRRDPRALRRDKGRLAVSTVPLCRTHSFGN